MAITISEAIQRTVEHREIFADEMTSLWMDLMTGKLTPAQIAGLIVGLRVKKETIGEITAAAKVMRDLSTKVNVRDPESLLDIVGTGGDGARTFNISTTSMFVIAAAGGRVAKHGGGSVSSKSGAADALKAIGANIMLKPEQIAQCIEETHMGFMFAPLHHAAMKYAAPVRKELGIRTIFNILGPLTNPANAGCEMLGVFHQDLVGICVRVLRDLGTKRAVVVFGCDGMDEVSLGATTMVGELKDGVVSEYNIHPEDFNLPMSSVRHLQVNNPEESVAKMMSVLHAEEGPAMNSVIFNAGVGLFTLGTASSIEQGIAMARKAIESGEALAKMKLFVEKTKELIRICREKGMSLEAEVGAIGGEEDGVIGMGECADPNECKMIADLGVDMLAAGIGNIHGKYPANWKGLSFETLAAVKEAVGDMPLVLHGGTGIPEDMIKKAISLGVAKINVNTECQLAFADATRKYIEAGKDLEGKGFDPRKLLAPGAEAIKATVKTKMELFGSVGKAD